MDIHLKIAGTIMIILAAAHAVFPRYFDWANELRSASLINRQMMYVHAFFVAFTVLLIGIFCITSTESLIETPLGRQFCLGVGIFWFVRLIIQFFGYSSELWRGKTFETGVHILFSILWIYFSVVFLAVYFW